jgi:hypothetical protein
MTERILGVLVFCALFVAFGLMTRRLGHRGCTDCGGACGTTEGGACDTGVTDSPHDASFASGDASDEKNPAGWWG